MKRVRIVAITAVALGAAVTAGTKFQQSREAEVQIAAVEPAAEPRAEAPVAAAAAPVAATSLTALAPDRREAPSTPSLIAQAPDAPLARPSIAAPHSALVAPRAEPSLAQASIVPGIDAGPGPDTSATHPATLRQLAASDGTGEVPAPPLDPALQAELAACAVWLVVTPSPGAMLETSVYAPCDGGGTVTLSHAGLTFDARLSADGQLLAQIPALTEQASVVLQFADGREQSDQTQVPDLAMIERVVLQWQAPAALQLNAYEFGAGYGDVGHVYAGAPRSAGLTDQGFLTVLGDPGIERAHLAQVYSYPRGETPRNGRVALEIEAPVTDAICGQPLTANTIELHGTASAQVRQIRIDMPACDGQGGYLVLPGVLPELQIALNQ